jgi:GGDEF domain-containing protein
MPDLMENRQVAIDLPPEPWDAAFDPSTGLGHAAFLMACARRALDRRSRHGETVAVLATDLPELCGSRSSTARSAPLAEAAGRRLRSTMRVGDLVARVGTVSFAVLCDDIASPSDVATIAGRMMIVLDEPFGSGDEAVIVESHVGAAIPLGRDETPRSLILRSFDALAASRADRNRRFDMIVGSSRSDG